MSCFSGLAAGEDMPEPKKHGKIEHVFCFQQKQGPNMKDMVIQPYFLCLVQEKAKENHQGQETAHTGVWCVPYRGLVCAPQVPSGTEWNQSDSDRNFGKEHLPNSREISPKFPIRFQSEWSVPSSTKFRPVLLRTTRNCLELLGFAQKNSHTS